MTLYQRVRPFVSVLFRTVVLGGVVSLAPATLLAQLPPAGGQVQPLPGQDFAVADWSDQIPAHLAIVDGEAELERDGQVGQAVENTPLLAGDRLRTLRGRVEVLFSDGSALDVDEYTDVDLLSDTLVRLNEGALRLSIARAASTLDYRVDGAGATAWIQTAGDYRVTVAGVAGGYPEMRLTVLRGLAELESPFGRALVRAGSESRVTAQGGPSAPYPVSAAAIDSFGVWVRLQHNGRVGTRSAQYLPTELRLYGGAFDRYGSWQYQRGYGYVWYPRVAATWRPYFDGHWSYAGALGWTWIGVGRWTWPTHHYGRWGHTAGRWFWIPGTRWAPAWVSWASAPGYIGWCPLDYYGRPVYAFTTFASFGRGWTVVQARTFSAGFSSRRYAVGHLSIPGPVRNRFVNAPRAPVRVATARVATRPLAGPGLRSARAVPRAAVPRAGTPRAPTVVPAPRAVGASPRVRPSSSSPSVGSSSPRVATPRSAGVTRSGTRVAAPRSSASGRPQSSAPPRVSRPTTPAPSSRATSPRSARPSTPRSQPSARPAQRAPSPRAGSSPPARSAPPSSASRPSRVEGGGQSSQGRSAPSRSAPARGRAQPRGR